MLSRVFGSGRSAFAVALLLAAVANVSFAAEREVDPYDAILFEMFPRADRVGKLDGDPPSAPVYVGDELVGHAFFTDHITPLPAYSGSPISALVGVGVDGITRGVRVVRHEEPILIIGVTQQHLAEFVDQYTGVSVRNRIKIGGGERKGYVTVDGISGATITAMVLNTSISKSIQTIAGAKRIAADPTPAGEPRVGKDLSELAHVSRDKGAAEKIRATESAEELWIEVWRERRVRIAILLVSLVMLTAILLLQDWITQYATIVRRIRIGFLIYTVVFIGWYSLAQLSVLNVFTFARTFMTEFHWEIFLIAPMTFILWSFVAMSLLLWGRGIYCGWLCPYGALQELTNMLAQRLAVPQLRIGALVHDRLLATKYAILLALFGLSLYSLAYAVRYAEVEPFKTAFTLRFVREWPFVVYAGGLVLVSAVNGNFFCKYLCPLGAALTIGGHFRIFDWLRRRKECGRPCQICSEECPSQAVRPTGEINPNECHYCLDCQTTFWNTHKCPPLAERRKRFERQGQTPKPRIR